VECAEIPLKQQQLIVDSTYFPTSLYGLCDKVRVFRVYYEMCPQIFEDQLECTDFVPKELYQTQLSTTITNSNGFESFESLWKHVKAHFACNRHRQFLSAQTLTVDVEGTFSCAFFRFSLISVSFLFTM
jgi:hypothetical protein